MMFIDDTPTRNMLQITASSRRIRRRNRVGLILVDYIQLVDSEDSRDSRQEQIAKISRRLKALARALEVPVIALSQLNRAVESREDKRPRMADLRESGAIEQDADIVLLLHRPDYYDPNDQPGIAVLDVAKNRNGATGYLQARVHQEDHPIRKPRHALRASHGRRVAVLRRAAATHARCNMLSQRLALASSSIALASCRVPSAADSPRSIAASSSIRRCSSSSVIVVRDRPRSICLRTAQCRSA